MHEFGSSCTIRATQSSFPPISHSSRSRHLSHNFAERSTTIGKAYVQVVGSMTNEGQVDICNLTISIAGLDTATYKTPAWLPTYPKTQSFKAGTYFPFTAILPINADSLASYRYPTVDVRTGFFACDAALRPLPEDQVVPAPGTSRSSIEADDDFPGSNSGNSNNFGSKIRWSGLRTSAGAQMDCLGTCLANLHKQGDDCAAAAYVLHSGCLQNCPDTVPQWMVDACTKASCAAAQCALKTSASGPRRGGVGGSFAYIYSLMLGMIVYVGLWSLRNEGSF